MEIVIREYRDSDLVSLNKLLSEVYNLEKSGTNSNNIELVAVIDQEVVGYLTINKLYDSVRDINYAFINYVCVLKKYRNKGIASNMLLKVFDICRDMNISYIELTSNSSRVDAQELYINSGFVIRETNVFRKELL
ncbi:MAG: GNAT family N-acetyltransferase [Firmicutes bacterium]|nr:GNAT family N-acetyltransferase [Bacillota bacterium]